jgi:hypothetical protein
MRTYKALTTKDVVITPFDASKGFNLSLNECTGSINQIEFYYGINSDIFLQTNVSGVSSSIGVVVLYHSIKQLYYTNYISSSMNPSQSNPVEDIEVRTLIPGVQNPIENFDRYVGRLDNPRYDNYLQSTTTQSRYIPTGSNEKISVISIPTKLYGENIIPQTFEFRYTASITGDKFDIKDDGDGNLHEYPNGFSDLDARLYCGNIFYAHGIATFTSGAMAGEFKALDAEFASPTLASLNNKCLWYSSSYRIYESSYECTAAEDEFSYTLNPTALMPLDQLSTQTNALINSITANIGNGTPGVYENVQLTTTTGNGSGGLVTITITGTDGVGVITGITVTKRGYGYKEGDQLSTNDYPTLTFTLKKDAFYITSKNGDIYHDFATGSYFTPYATTVGLYDNDKNLLAVGKLSRPTPISKFVDTSIIVNYDY